MNPQRKTWAAWLNRLLGRQTANAGEEPSAPSVSPAAEIAIPGVDYRRAMERGLERMHAQDHAAAAREFESALAAQHDAAPAHYQLGLARMRLGQLEEAADSFVLATCFDAAMAPAYYALALVEDRQGKLDQALRSVDHALTADPRHADAMNLRGALLLRGGDIAEARASFECAVALEPGHARAHSNLGYVLFRDCGEYELGASHIERALALEPGNARFECNLSMVLAHRGELDATIALCDRLLAMDPAMDEARLNRGLALLKLGRFERGWEDYEARRYVRSNYVARTLPYPEWAGQDLSGKTLLVCGEQGIGDEIMFASCLGEVVARASRCVIDCSPRLETLFRRSFPSALVRGVDPGSVEVDRPSADPGIDFQVPAGSLPLRYRRSRNAFPGHTGYLVADPTARAAWRSRLAALGPGLKVGLTWRGGMPSTRQALRSMQLAELGPLLRMCGCEFVDLQYGDTAGERDAVLERAGLALQRWPEAIEDMDQCAALVSELDVVVSVCTAVVHLAGALGRPTWVMVPDHPEWRYMQAGEAMPWYPSVRLFRQRQGEGWAHVIAAIERALADRSGQEARATRPLLPAHGGR